MAEANVIRFPLDLVLRREGDDWALWAEGHLRAQMPTRAAVLRMAVHLVTEAMQDGRRARIREQSKPCDVRTLWSWRDRVSAGELLVSHRRRGE